MFKRIMPGEEADTLNFLLSEPEINYYILGYIECFGLANPNLELWIENGDGTSPAILFRYADNFYIYAPGGADWQHAACVIRNYSCCLLSGRPEYVQNILECLGSSTSIHDKIYMRLSPGTLRANTSIDGVISVNLENLDKYLNGIVDLRRNIPEFSLSISEEALRSELQLGCKRILIALEGSRAVSMAMTTVERRQAAMVVGVCTRQECRGKGYALALMTALCRQLETEGKAAILFYSNPVAGRIYSSLGFEDIGRWCFASFG